MTTVNNWATTAWCSYAWCLPTEENALHTQLLMVGIGSPRLGMQVRLIKYNIDKLRILWEIKSDGTTANNFTASSEESTDKGVINLKSDIVEKYWQSTGDSAEWVRFDAGSGETISLDTFALIGHNLSGSATLTLKGYGDGSSSAPADWSVVATYATLTVSEDPDEENLIWVSPTNPSAAYRWWRLDIADPTNADGYIRIGRLVAGTALIFSGENCLDQIGLVEQSFKDEMQLNGFTRISNNRALKRKLVLRFKDLNKISQSNYRGLRRYMRYCRDSLKALVIVDPSTESSKYEFSAFAKLQVMPVQEHKFVDSDNSYSSFDLEFDEGR
jgi:hypothetical protein